MAEDTLGDRIRARRERIRQVAEIARLAAQDWAKEYTDNAKVLIQTYVDNQITAALETAKTYVDNQLAQSKTYVDNQILAAKAAGKTYTDAQIASLVTKNNLLPP